MQSTGVYQTSLVIPTGATTGTRITINQNQDGAILVYDAANFLVGSIAGTDAIDVYGNAFQLGVTAYNDFRGYTNLSGNTITCGILPNVGTGYSVFDMRLQGGNGFDVWEGSVRPTIPSQSDSASILLQAGADGAVLGSGPLVVISDLNGDSPVAVYVNGAVAKYNQSLATPYSWQTPTYNTSWAGSTTFTGTTCQTLRYRLDAEDNLWLEGAFHITAAGAGASVFALPAGYHDTVSTHFLACLEHSATGTFGCFGADVSAAGNFNLNTGAGFTRNSGDEFYVNAKVPLGSLA